MKKFFNDFFLQESSIYTLFGTKPMSEVTIVTATEKEWIDSYAAQLQTLDEKTKNKAINAIKRHCQKDDFAENWLRWLAWLEKYPQSRFLFMTQPINKHLFSAYIINVPQVIWTLQKHYAVFSRELGMEFDPVKAAQEFTHPDSMLWKKIFSSDFLQGILHGFGKRNAYFFSIKQREGVDLALFSDRLIQGKEEDVTIKHLKLPVFRSYNSLPCEDPILAKYKQERELIEKQLKDKDFTQEVLNQLSRS